MSKICSKCGAEYPETSEYFGKSSRGKNGLGWRCKPCIAEYGKKRREEYPNYGKNHYESNKNDYASRFKQYAIDHKKEIVEYKKRYYQDNKLRLIEPNKKYRETNKDAIAKNKHIYYETNKESLTEKNKQWGRDNPEEYAIIKARWKRNNPDKVNTNTQKRRSIKKQLPSTLSAEQWELAKKVFKNKCCYCGEEKPLAQEHFHALAKSGEHSHLNIIPSCQKCNSSKGTRSFFDWYPKQPFYSKTREQKILKYLNYKNETQQFSLAF